MEIEQLELRGVKVKVIFVFTNCFEDVIGTHANIKIATLGFIFSYQFLVFVAQYGQLLVLSTC